MSMDFKCLVWKRVWKISFFGLKQGQDLENRAVHPIKNSQESPPPPPPPIEPLLSEIQACATKVCKGANY